MDILLEIDVKTKTVDMVLKDLILDRLTDY